MPERETVTETNVTPTPAAVRFWRRASPWRSPPIRGRIAIAAEAVARTKEEATQTLQEATAPLPKVMAPDPITLPLKSKSLRRLLQSPWEARRAAARTR